jgi:hypothetical protein
MSRPADHPIQWSDQTPPLRSKWQRVLLSPFRLAIVLPELSARLSKYLVMNVAVRPTVLAALGAHGLLLFLPLWELHTPEVEELNPPKEEDPTIEAVSLGDLLATEEEPAAPVDNPPSQPEPQVAAAPQSVAQPVLTEVPEDLPEELPTAEPIAEPEEPLLPDEPEPEPEQSLAFDPGRRGQLTSSVNAVLGRTTGSDFDNTDQWPPLPSQIRWIPETDLPAFFTPDSIQNGSYQPFNGAGLKFIGRNAELIAREDLPQTTAQAGFSLGPEESYGNHPLFAIAAADGQPVAYLSLLDMKGSTVVITWPYDPRQGIQ